MTETFLAAPNVVDVAALAYARAHPDRPPIVGAVLYFEGSSPSLDQLREHVAAHATDFPSLSHNLVRAGRRWTWRSHRLDPHIHVRERTLPSAADVDAEVREIMARPLPDGAPPWDVWLIRGYSNRGYAIVYRVHHSIQDGGAMAMAAAAVFGPTTPKNSKPRPGHRATVREVLRATWRLRQFAVRTNLWTPQRDPGIQRAVLNWVEVPVDQLATIGRARGGTANDAYLAALTLALRTWSNRHWPAAAGRALPAFMPMNHRAASERTMPGNRVLPAMITLPCDEVSPARALDRLVSATRFAKTQKRPLRAIVARAPMWAANLAARLMATASRATVDTSNFTLGGRLSLGPDPAYLVRPITFLPAHHPVSAVLCTYNGTATVCFVTDSGLPGLDQLPKLWLAAVAELEATVGDLPAKA